MNFVDKFDGSFPSLDAHARGSVHVDSVSTKAPHGSIVVEDGHFLFTADFKRSGVDLVLTKDDQELVLHDYFKGEKRAALASPDGAHLTGDLINALTGYTQFAQAGGAAEPAKVIGHVTKLTGNATAIRNGVSIVLNQGDNVLKGDVVQSGSESTLGITFIDGTVFGLGPNAKMVLNEMIYDPNGSNNSSLMSLVQGTISFVAGATAKHGDMKVDTPVATMGIRGTAVLVEIDFDVQGTGGVPPAKFQVLVEPDGTTGSYILFDKTTLNPIATVDQAGTQTQVNGQGSVSFISSANLSADAQKLISDVFALKFTDNTNPNTKLTTNFTDSVIPISTGFTLANGDFVKQTIYLLNLIGNGPTQGNSNPTRGPDHIPGPPEVVTFDGSFIEQAGLTHSGLIDSVSRVIRWADLNPGDTPSAKVSFTSFAYHDAQNSDVTASLTDQQRASIEAVEVPLLLEHTPGNRNVGSATWTYNVADGAFDFLAAGETLTLTYTARVDNNFTPSNETTFKTFTITITGTNDTPVVTSAAQIGGITEITDAANSTALDVVQGTLAFYDTDLTDTHTVTITGVATSGVTTGLAGQATVLSWLSLGALSDSTDGVTGSRGWTFSAADRNFDYLAAGETLTVTYTIQIDDQHGGVVALPVTITIVGTDDTPVITSSTQAAAITEAGGVTGSQNPDVASGTVTFTDLDLSDTHGVTVADVTGSGVTSGLPDQATILSWLSLGTLTDSTGGVTGSRGWTFSAADKSFDYLAAGETLTLTYLIQVDDHHGGVVTQPVTITITGTNDTPVVTSAPQTAVIAEAAATTNSPQLDSVSGTMTFTDADLSDTHGVTITGVSESGATGGLPGQKTVLSWLSLGTLTDTTGGAAGAQAWSFSAADKNFDYLALGETLTLTYTIQIDDHHGGVIIKPITITINGANDAPTLADVHAGAIADTADNDTFNLLTGTLHGHDVDDGETATLTYAALDAHGLPVVDSTIVGHYGSLLVSANGTYTYYPDPAAINALIAGAHDIDTFDIQTIDAHGAVGVAHLTIDVTGANDTPTLANTNAGTLSDTAANDSFGNLTGHLAGNDRDTGEIATLSYAVLNSDHIATSVVTGLYGSLTVNADGTYTYVPDAAAINALAAGAYADTFTVKTTDVHGASVTATLTVQVEGVNDAPVFAGKDLALTYESGGSPVALAGNVTVNDVDSANYLNGSLTATVTDGGHVGDTLTIVGNDHISVSGTTVMFDADGVGGADAISIGTLIDQLNSLTINLNGNADDAAVAALAQAIEFENSTASPQSGTRTVTFTLHDGGGTANGGVDSDILTTTVNVSGNHPAVIGGDLTGDVYEDDHIVIPSGATIANDVDSGTLTVQDADAGQDHFVAVAPDSLTGTYGDFTFDENSGNWTYALMHDRVDDLAAGEIKQDTLTVTTADGTTQDITITVHGTNDAPVVIAKDLGATYSPGGSAVALVDSVSVSDIDSVDYNGGSLAAHISSGQHDGDLLSIAANDQYISVSGTTIMFDADGDGSGHAVAIGTLSDNVGDLVIDLNAAATNDAVAHLIEAVQFQSTDGNPEAGQRTVEFALNDGGGTEHNGHDTGYVYTAVNVGSATLSANLAPLIATDNLQISQGFGLATAFGLSASDADAGPAESFALNVATEADGSFVTPSIVSGTLADINAALASGLTYHSGPNSPLSDKVAIGVTDGLGATDTVNFLFNVTGDGPLQGADGKDVLVANGTAHTLTGGAGADQFVFAVGSGSATVTDFAPGEDRIDLFDHTAPFVTGNTDSFNAWINNNSAVEQLASGTLIHLDAGDTIMLSNVTRSSLHINDFILHPGGSST